MTTITRQVEAAVEGMDEFGPLILDIAANADDVDNAKVYTRLRLSTQIKRLIDLVRDESWEAMLPCLDKIRYDLPRAVQRTPPSRRALRRNRALDAIATIEGKVANRLEELRIKALREEGGGW